MSRVALFLLAALTLRGQPDELARKSAEVRQLMGEGRFAEAIPLCRDLVKALPENPGLRLNLGLALHMTGQPREAIPEFERVLKSQPTNFPALLSLGQARLELNDPAAAIGPLEKAVAADPAHVNARGMLASALITVGHAREASAHYRRLTSMTPADPKAWHGLGRSYESLAAQGFDQLNKTAQGSVEWLALVGDSRVSHRQFRAAFYFYKQAIEKRPDFRVAREGLATVYRATGHPDWAETEMKKAAALPKPDCVRDKPACDYAAGRLLDAAGGASPYWKIRANNELARQAFSKLGQLPESVEVHALKADIAANLGQWVEAANEWRAAMKLAPDDPALEQQLAMVLHQGGDYQSSLPMFRKMLAAEPKSPDLNFFVGEAHLRLEQPEQALPYLEAAVRLNPKLLPAHASLGLAYMRTGKPAEAISHLEPVLEADDDGSLHFQLARAYQASGNAEKSKQAMAGYQAILKRNEAEKRDLEEKAQITAP